MLTRIAATFLLHLATSNTVLEFGKIMEEHKISSSEERSESSKLYQVTLSESMDISKAHDLKKKLRKALKHKEGVHIDMSKLERIDAAVVQLLMIFSKTAKSAEVHIEWDESSSVFNRAVTILDVSQYFPQSAE